MHRLFQPSKNSRDCTQTVRSESFSMVGQDLEHIVIRNFVIGRDAEVALDRKKRAGLYMVVRSTLFLWAGPNKRLPGDVGINIL